MDCLFVGCPVTTGKDVLDFMKKRCIALILGIMLLSFSASAETLPIVDEPVTLTYFISFSSEIIQTLEENTMYQELERLTGVDIEWIHPAGDAQQAFQLMIASNDLPDLVENCMSYYTGGADMLVEEGIAIRLNDYAEYMPNYLGILEEYPEIAKEVYTDTGNLVAFYCVQTTQEPPWDGMRIRQDWLDELGLEMPTTIDELTEVLRAFKNEMGATVPMTSYDRWKDQYGYFCGAWDIGPGFYQVDGEVRYGPIQPEYREYVETMRMWYEEGLYDPEYLTRSSASIQELISTNQTGVFNESQDPNFTDIKVAMPYPTLEEGATRHYSLWNTHTKNANEVFITTACENPEVAVQWLDFHYSDQGYMLFNYGVEGISYEMVDGEPVFTDLIMNNPNGYSRLDLCYVHKWHQGAYNRDYMAYPAMTEEYVKEMEVWASNTDGAYVMPPITMTSDEGSTYANIMSDIQTYVDEMTNRFIMGLEPMENYDAFVEQILSMDIEAAQEVQQAALDRYNNR